MRVLRIIAIPAVILVVPTAMLQQATGIDAEEGTDPSWFWDRDLDEFCDDTVSEMPKETPSRLIIDVMDEWNRSLVGETRISVESALNDALSVFSFSERVLPRFEPGEFEVKPGDHVMTLVVELSRRILSGGVVGRHCSNIVIIQYTSNPVIPESSEPQRFIRLLIHEMSHFFGLSHEWGTYTGHGAVGYADPRCYPLDRFSSRQLDLLDKWNNPGTELTPHWARESSCAEESFAFGLGAYGLLFALMGVPVGMIMVIRHLGGDLWGHNKKRLGRASMVPAMTAVGGYIAMMFFAYNLWLLVALGVLMLLPTLYVAVSLSLALRHRLHRLRD